MSQIPESVSANNIPEPWCSVIAHLQAERDALQRENERLKALLSDEEKGITYCEIDELCCEWGAPKYVQTEDGEAWFWKFEGSDLPVADHLSELLWAARQIVTTRPFAARAALAQATPKEQP